MERVEEKHMTSDMNLREKTLGVEKIFDGKVVHLERATVELPSGRTSTREVVRHVGAAAVVAVDNLGRIALVRQWRCAAGRALDEIPAGKLDDFGADRLEAARRELREETGLSAASFRHLADIFTSVGFSDEVIGLYLATGLSQGESSPDEDEFLNVFFVDARELIARIYAGEIEDGKTVCAVLLAQPILKEMGIL